MQAYENGGHAYHATMPTDSLAIFRDVLEENRSLGLSQVQAWQFELGNRIRNLLESKGFKSVAAKGYKAPGVIVSYTQDDDIKNGKKFAAAGIQIAAGVPLMCDEPADFKTFRIGLFGLDKLQNIDPTVNQLKEALDRIS
jgi:aspartate aminotransferase-like enzyme